MRQRKLNATLKNAHMKLSRPNATFVLAYSHSLAVSIMNDEQLKVFAEDMRVLATG
jgi:hypothetical protein